MDYTDAVKERGNLLLSKRAYELEVLATPTANPKVYNPVDRSFMEYSDEFANYYRIWEAWVKDKAELALGYKSVEKLEKQSKTELAPWQYVEPDFEK